MYCPKFFKNLDRCYRSIKTLVQGTVSSFSFCVDSVTHAALDYDSGANLETCDNY